MTRSRIETTPPASSGNKSRRNVRRLPRRGVRPGPAKFELAVTLGFALAMVRAVLMGGPTDLGKAAVVAVPYFLFGLLVVRKGLLSVTVLPILISPFFDNQTSHELHLDNPQVVFWIVGFAVWASAVSMGFWIRRWIDR